MLICFMQKLDLFAMKHEIPNCNGGIVYLPSWQAWFDDNRRRERGKNSTNFPSDCNVSKVTSNTCITKTASSTFSRPIGHLSLNLGQCMKFFKVPMHSGNSLMLGQSPIINLCKEFVDPWRSYFGNASVANLRNSIIWKESGWIFPLSLPPLSSNQAFHNNKQCHQHS